MPWIMRVWLFPSLLQNRVAWMSVWAGTITIFSTGHYCMEKSFLKIEDMIPLSTHISPEKGDCLLWYLQTSVCHSGWDKNISVLIFFKDSIHLSVCEWAHHGIYVEVRGQLEFASGGHFKKLCIYSFCKCEYVCMGVVTIDWPFSWEPLMQVWR